MIMIGCAVRRALEMAGATIWALPERNGAPMTAETRELWTRLLDGATRDRPITSLRPPAQLSSIDELEVTVGQVLPEALKIGWLLHDGQDELPVQGVALGYRWLPVSGVAAEWATWRQLREEEPEEGLRELNGPCRSFPKQAIRKLYTAPGWIPVFQCPLEGNYVGLDFDPGPAGRPGQVINFGRDEDEKFVAAPDFATLLAWLADEVGAGSTHRDDDLVTTLRHDLCAPGA